MKRKKAKNEDYGGVTYETIQHTEISESYDIETLYEIENNNDLIRLEMNTIEFPLFTKNKRIKENTIITYEFNGKKNQYLKVSPIAGDRIPSEFEEKIFFALMKLYKQNGHNQTIYTDYFTLILEMGVSYNGKILAKVKKGLDILNKTNFEFNNLFYGNEIGGIINENISTNMFTIRRIELREAQKIQNKEMLKYFRNTKIKEIIQIHFAKHFYDNIIRRGYLYFDRQDLLQIENSVSRTIYLMLTKWRNKKLYIRPFSKFLASRIPLSWKKDNISSTIKILKSSFEDLKNKGLIQKYSFNSENGYDTSYFEVWFEEKHNKNYFDPKRDNDVHDGLEITSETQEKIRETEIVTSEEYPIYEQEHIKQARELFKLLPEKARELKTIQKKLEGYLKKQEYEYVKDAVLYTSKNAKKSFGKYLDECISNHWHEEFSVKKQVSEKKAKAKKEQDLEHQKALEEVMRKQEEERKAKTGAIPVTRENKIISTASEDILASVPKQKKKNISSLSLEDDIEITPELEKMALERLEAKNISLDLLRKNKIMYQNSIKQEIRNLMAEEKISIEEEEVNRKRVKPIWDTDFETDSGWLNHRIEGFPTEKDFEEALYTFFCEIYRLPKEAEKTVLIFEEERELILDDFLKTQIEKRLKMLEIAGVTWEKHEHPAVNLIRANKAYKEQLEKK